MKKIILSLKSLIVFTLLLSFSGIGHSEELKIQSEKDLTTHLESLMNCRKNGSAPASKDGQSFFCSLKFRGLEMELPGVNASGSGIYVSAMGKNQMLYPLGNKCLVVSFTDQDLLIPGHGDFTAIIFKNDGTISHLYKNDAAKKQCMP
ncbi:MAG: hypothetical protein JNK65_09740 [Deltaproteobacteria bacterium]|nr:hypothetical protein [Deltaproteobacteria bacterium]